MSASRFLLRRGALRPSVWAGAAGLSPALQGPRSHSSPHKVSRAVAARATTATVGPYDWITAEAQSLIANAYNRHHSLADKSQSYPPAVSEDNLRHAVGPFHYAPKDWVDRAALASMRFLRRFVHAFFRENYLHHSVCLETVAAVPGICAAAHRHMRSLRRMQRDHGWINPLQEEAENERMHLLIWMQIAKPSMLERGLVLFAQASYTAFYTGLYLLSPRGAHRLVGYLEEEAFAAYTSFIDSIDQGKIPNVPASDIARQYYRMPPDARLSDVVLHVRCDESLHGAFNHMLADKYAAGELDSPPHFMVQDLRAEEATDHDRPVDSAREPPATATK